MTKKTTIVKRTVKTKNQYGTVEYKIKLNANKAKLIDKAKELEREQKNKNKAMEKRLKEIEKQAKLIESLEANKEKCRQLNGRLTLKK